MIWFEFFVGLVLLVIGADFLVRGASRLAEDVGISHLVVGLTVVAYGTSTPELAVSTGAALQGQGGIAVGNVVGSNIFNVLFIVGLVALISPLPVARRIVNIDMPLLIGISLLLLVMGLGLHYGVIDGAILTIGILSYTVLLIYFDRKQIRAEKAALGHSLSLHDMKFRSVLFNVALIVGGLFCLVRGADWFVQGASQFARYFDVDPLIIGLTIVGAGTSLPELMTSIIAAVRGKTDIVIGNVIGSNLFNIMAVLGVSGLAAPNGITISPSVNSFDMVVMIMALVVCLPVFYTTRTISPKFGIYLFGLYVLYTWYLVHAAVNKIAVPGFAQSLVFIVLPLLIIAMLQYLVGRRKLRSSS